MTKNNIAIIIVFLCLCYSTGSQTELSVTKKKNQNKSNTIKSINPLGPTTAAFYSAVLPGLGQFYNKKYWKIPIVYAAIGSGLYFYIDNSKVYDRYRSAYKRRLAGFTDDEFYGPSDTPFISNEALIRAQKTLKRNKEISMLVTVGMYVLNIIDANVDAHLMQYNVDENLSFKPFFDLNNPNVSLSAGISLNLIY